jgi:hypothetical protein
MAGLRDSRENLPNSALKGGFIKYIFIFISSTNVPLLKQRKKLHFIIKKTVSYVVAKRLVFFRKLQFCNIPQ